MIVTLPISAGPAYVFIAMEHPDAFVGASAEASLIANAAMPAYLVTYAFLAPRHGVVLSLGSALLAWIGVVLAARTISWELPQLLTLNIVLYAIAFVIFSRAPPPPVQAHASGRWWEIPLRAILVMLTAGAVIVVARQIGPAVAGLIAIAPIGFSSMAVVLHTRNGGRNSAAVFMNALPGMIGFGLALLVVRLTAVPEGKWTALILALLTGLTWNAALISYRHGRQILRTARTRNPKTKH
ncbi:MAG TPA: hypothetical protein VMX97_18135 [Hyphomicrobiaceae bacterium]|nr:hypothetical protein [Hyphomicrobiaceae bacterium]